MVLHETMKKIFAQVEGNPKGQEMSRLVDLLKVESDSLLRSDNPEEKSESIRGLLQSIGTDVNKNDADPLGNGDQSPISSTTDFLIFRYIDKNLGQLHATQKKQGIDSTFTHACVDGNVSEVQKTLLSVCSRLDPPFCRQDEYQALLETRETGLRLSPLLLVVSLSSFEGGINLDIMNTMMDSLKIAKILLRAGASPDCKDALGRTVVHHGAGNKATPLSFKMVDMCIAAAKTSDLYGKDVVFEGLDTEHMNGKTGIVGGFDYDSDRRSVYIPELNKEVWVKPEKLRLLDGNERQERTKLVDVPDRRGQVPLMKIVEGDEDCNEREDVAEYLIHKHGASIDIKDESKEFPTSPATLAMIWSPSDRDSKVLAMVAAKARADAKKRRDANKSADNFCANCDKSLGQGGSKCAKCKVTFYCSRGCQVHHWKHGNHKQECQELVVLASGVKLSSEHLVSDETPQTQASMARDFNLGDAARIHQYQKPEGVKVGERFVVTVQGTNAMEPFLICDETQTCHFQYEPSGPGHGEIWKEVQKESAWDGKKTFMKASFDEEGECTLYPSTACVKNKYRW